MIDDNLLSGDVRGPSRPSLNDALRWIGSRVDDTHGASIGRLEDIWVDPVQGEPRWLLVKEGRFGGRHTLIPFLKTASAGGRVWIPYERRVVRSAPEVRPGSPLSAELERELTEHYRSQSGAVPSGAGIATSDDQALQPGPQGPAAAMQPPLVGQAPTAPPPPAPLPPAAASQAHAPAHYPQPPQQQYQPAPHPPQAAPPSPPRPPAAGYEHGASPAPWPGHQIRPDPGPPPPAADPNYREVEIEVNGRIRITGDFRIVESDRSDPGRD